MGHSTGWTKYYGDDGLIITGGVVSGVEYLDSIQYKKKLSNRYNNYVNPFYLFGIMSDAGKSFFVGYYKDEINKLMQGAKTKRENLEIALEDAKEKERKIFKAWSKFLDSQPSVDKNN